jgi:3-hydroxybutyrate dehydrogenase
MTLETRNAIVTGSTSGIGHAIARALGRRRANVMINRMRDAAAIEAERAGMAKEFGVTAVYSGAYMTKPDKIHAMVEKAEAKFGSVDILVNNAGFSMSRRSRNFHAKTGTGSLHQSLRRVP